MTVISSHSRTKNYISTEVIISKLNKNVPILGTLLEGNEACAWLNKSMLSVL